MDEPDLGSQAGDAPAQGYLAYENQTLRTRLAATEKALVEARRASYPWWLSIFAVIGAITLVSLFVRGWIAIAPEPTAQASASKSAKPSLFKALQRENLLETLRPVCKKSEDIPKELAKRGLKCTVSDDPKSTNEYKWGKLVIDPEQVKTQSLDGSVGVESLYHFMWKNEHLAEFDRRRKAIVEKRKVEEAKSKAAERKSWGSLWSMHQKHPEWCRQDCEWISEHRYWIGMTVEQMKRSLGEPENVNVSNYGYGNQYQYCYYGECLYDQDDDGIIDSYN